MTRQEGAVRGDVEGRAARRTAGPYDADDLDPDATPATGLVDFGAVRVPVPDGGTVQVELKDGRLQAVHIALPEGRLSVSALAAPKSSPVWPDLVTEIAESLRSGGARVRSYTGDWGRELHATTDASTSVFVGSDGPRWMLYGVATGPTRHAVALDDQLRRMLRGTVVVRGRSPYPVRTVLPLEVPEHLAEPDAGADAARPADAAAPARAEGPAQAGPAGGPRDIAPDPAAPPLWADPVPRIADADEPTETLGTVGDWDPDDDPDEDLGGDLDWGPGGDRDRDRDLEWAPRDGDWGLDTGLADPRRAEAPGTPAWSPEVAEHPSDLPTEPLPVVAADDGRSTEPVEPAVPRHGVDRTTEDAALPGSSARHGGRRRRPDGPGAAADSTPTEPLSLPPAATGGLHRPKPESRQPASSWLVPSEAFIPEPALLADEPAGRAAAVEAYQEPRSGRRRAPEPAQHARSGRRRAPEDRAAEQAGTSRGDEGGHRHAAESGRENRATEPVEESRAAHRAPEPVAEIRAGRRRAAEPAGEVRGGRRRAPEPVAEIRPGRVVPEPVGPRYAGPRSAGLHRGGRHASGPDASGLHAAERQATDPHVPRSGGRRARDLDAAVAPTGRRRAPEPQVLGGRRRAPEPDRPVVRVREPTTEPIPVSFVDHAAPLLPRSGRHAADRGGAAAGRHHRD